MEQEDTVSNKDITEFLVEAQRIATILRDRLVDDPAMQGREGGFLCVADRKGQPLLIVQIGRVGEAKLAQYYRNAIEKSQRLTYATHFTGHTLSRQSRDEVREHWIGAVAGISHFLSFSGYIEDVDEIFMLLLAMDTHELTVKAARNYAQTGGNSYFERLEDLF